jgi:hypothetical protein
MSLNVVKLHNSTKSRFPWDGVIPVWSCIIPGVSEAQVNAGVCSLLSKGVTVANMVLFSLQCFDFDMYSYSGFTLLFEHMKNICEGKSQI